MNYEDMSDFEINKLVGSRLGLLIDKGKQESYMSMLSSFQERDYAVFFDDGEWHDYCNNPSDAWPLLLSLVNDGCTIVIEKNKINGDFLNGKSITRKIAELYISFKAD